MRRTNITSDSSREPSHRAEHAGASRLDPARSAAVERSLPGTPRAARHGAHTRIARGCAALLVAAVLCAASGCVRMLPVRFSTVEPIGLPASTFVVRQSQADALARLEAELRALGFPLVDRHTAPSGAMLYLFRGRRANATVVQGSRYAVSSTNYQFGSVFYVRMRNVATGVEVFIVGKPTINGVDACSNADRIFAEFQYYCRDTMVREDSTLRSQVDGRDETDVVRGVLLRLGELQTPDNRAGP